MKKRIKRLSIGILIFTILASIYLITLGIIVTINPDTEIYNGVKIARSVESAWIRISIFVPLWLYIGIFAYKSSKDIIK